MTRQKQLQGMEMDKNIFACMNNFVHNMIACEQALLGVTRGYNYIAVKVTISPKVKSLFFFSCTRVESTGNCYKTIFPIIILMIDHFGQSDYFR